MSFIRRSLVLPLMYETSWKSTLIAVLKVADVACKFMYRKKCKGI